MRTVSIVLLLSGVATLAASARAAPAKAPTVPCTDIIGQAKTGRDGGYRIVLGVVSVPPARLTQVAPTHALPWRYWRKAGLVIRASSDPVGVSVPRAWRTRVAITWGSSGTVSSLRIAACASPAGLWNAYAGGFYIRTRRQCVPLTFKVGERSRTVRFGIGDACPR